MKKCPYCAEEIQDQGLFCPFCGKKIEPIIEAATPPAAFPIPGSLPNSPDYLFALERRIIILEEESRRLSGEVGLGLHLSEKKMNQKIENINIELDKIRYLSLISPNFLSRAFAVWGHFFVAQLIIAASIYIIFFLISLVIR